MKQQRNGFDHIGSNLKLELEEKRKIENGNGGEMLIAPISDYRAKQQARDIVAQGKEAVFIYNHLRGALVHVCPKDEEQHWIDLEYLIAYFILDGAVWRGQKVHLGR